MAKRIEPKAEFIGKLNVERAMKLLLDFEAAEAGLVPIEGTFKIWRDSNDTRTEEKAQPA